MMLVWLRTAVSGGTPRTTGPVEGMRDQDDRFGHGREVLERLGQLHPAGVPLCRIDSPKPFTQPLRKGVFLSPGWRRGQVTQQDGLLDLGGREGLRQIPGGLARAHRRSVMDSGDTRPAQASSQEPCLNAPVFRQRVVVAWFSMSYQVQDRRHQQIIPDVGRSAACRN
jgi:hypothetical protein